MIVDRYYYNQLNSKEQAIYRAFYDGVMAHKDTIPVPFRGKMSSEMFSRIYTAMTRDNPLIYFLNQSACSYVQDILGHTAICPQYFFSKETIKKYNRKIEKVVNGLAETLKLTEGSDYDKELKIHDWMCQNITYDDQGSDPNEITRVIASHNIIGVFAHHKAQCEGIAKAVKVLLNAVDVKCIVATGDAIEHGVKIPHAWNVVNIDGKAYHLDVTWDLGNQGKIDNVITYDYFNLTDEMMKIDHMPDEDKLPVCDTTKYNYFNKNKCCFITKLQLFDYVTRKLRSGDKTIYFRVSPKANIIEIIDDILGLALRELGGTNQNGIRIHHTINKELGICWVKII